MKLVYLPLLCATGLLACGSSTTGDDAGSDGSTGGDATTDATSNDSGGGDAAADAPVDSGSDGSLDGGSTCDPQNDQCGAGLICCAGGAVFPDGGVGHCIVRPDSGKCPPVP
ncbi:MAG TPA: hypothetical protein VGH28_07865 [Polyangiaceae bacterium]